MLALAWPWHAAADQRIHYVERLRTSLCAGIGGHAGGAEIAGLHFAYRALRSNAAQARSWRPATLPGGRIAVFHGYFDNAAEIAAELGADRSDLSRLYGLSVERWGDETEQRVIGEYCAIVAEPG